MNRAFGGALLAGALMTLAACGGTGAATESSSEYPSDTIRLLTPYDAGGPSDLTARTYAEALSKDLGVSVVVENKPGGSGAVGTQELISAEPDGYTLGLITTGTTVTTPLANNVGYTHEDVTPLGVMAEVGSAFVVHQSSPYKDAESFFADAEAKPGKFTVGVPGASTPQAIEMQRLADEYGVELSIVPFNGNAEMLTALLGKNVDSLMINASDDVLAYLEDGSMRALATSGSERDSAMPDAPTFVELGYEDLTMAVSIFGLAGPAGLPEDISKELTESLAKASKEPKVIETIGDRLVPDEFKDAEDLAKILDETQTVYEPILGK
jgi:tripartite-type tricarboxylate transporter receptor subunit TctC